MKVLGNLPFAKDSDDRYPFGSNIQNETDTQDGTPVVRELYGDVLMNLYKALELTGITPTDTEDNDNSQYQLIEALKKLPNSLNDIEQVLNKTGNVWELSFNFDLLPDRYFLFARASELYNSSTTYTIKGTTSTEYSFTSPTGFAASDELLIVLDSSEVRAYSLTKLTAPEEVVNTVLGTPIALNDTAKMYYKDSGYLMTDLPSSDEIQQKLRVFESEGALILHEMFVHNDLLVCFASFPVSPTQDSYVVYDIDINDFDNITANSLFATIDPSPSVYCYMGSDGSIYMSNQGGFSADDYRLSKFTRNISGTFSFVSTTVLDVAFEKTTNAVIEGGFIFTLVGGYLRKYDLSTGVKTEVMYLPGVNGQLFRFNGGVYFGSGEVATKWTL